MFPLQNQKNASQIKLTDFHIEETMTLNGLRRIYHTFLHGLPYPLINSVIRRLFKTTDIYYPFSHHSFFEGHNPRLYFFSTTFLWSSTFLNISNAPIKDQYPAL